MFIFVLGVVCGFSLALITNEWLKSREKAQQAKIAREEQIAKDND